MSDAFKFHLKVLTGELITMRDNAHTSIPILITLSYAPLIVFTFGKTAHSKQCVARHVLFQTVCVCGAAEICQSWADRASKTVHHSHFIQHQCVGTS